MSEERPILSTSLQNKSVVESIIDRIISAIIEGELKPGEKLPTEMELCRDLEVGRNSVREAIKKLEAYGVVYIKRAEGTFVSQNYNHKMLDPMLYGMLLKLDKWQDLIELRQALDIGTLYLALGHSYKKEQMEVLKSILEVMRRACFAEKPSVADIMNVDTSFHMQIAKMMDNELLINITDYISRITIPSRRSTIGWVIENREEKHFIELHEQLIQVLENRQYDQVEKAVTDHYVYWKEEKPETGK